MKLIFWDTKIIMINKWVDEIYKKFKNPKVLEKYIREDWQKDLMETYKELKDENKKYKWNKWNIDRTILVKIIIVLFVVKEKNIKEICRKN